MIIFQTIPGHARGQGFEPSSLDLFLSTIFILPPQKKILHFNTFYLHFFAAFGGICSLTVAVVAQIVITKVKKNVFFLILFINRY